MSHIVTLAVVTKHEAGWTDAFNTLSKVALASGDQFKNVTVSSIEMEDELELTEDLDCIEEFHDENTMFKARDAIRKGITDTSPRAQVDDVVTDIVTSLQNAGILFREIRK